MSQLGHYLAGTQGRRLGRACLSSASWEDSSLDHPVIWTIGWLEELERKHRDTCLRILATTFLIYGIFLRFASQSQADTWGC